MNVSLYQAAAALNSSARWQELVSENLAASSVPGFKKQQLSFSTIQAGMMAPTGGSRVNSSQHFLLPGVTSSTNFSAGQMKFTGSKTDLAVDGSAFFEVQLTNGQKAYTRDGEFKINSQGQLTTKDGGIVQGSSGGIQVNLSSPAPITVSSNGTISQGGQKLGSLKLVKFGDPNLLTRIGSGYYVADGTQAQPSDATDSTVKQGYLEAANTSSVTEMANLITAMRHYEANQRIIQMQDDRMGRMITDVANPS